MFALRRPSEDALRRYVAAQAALPFGYAPVGATQGAPPAGYRSDHHRAVLGRGLEVFRRAAKAIRAWEMFRLGWVEVLPPDAPLRPGTVVGVLVHHLGLWSLNPCRIVYVVDETGPVERFGFAYGTLPGHAAMGEERFTVEWDRTDDTVVYDLLAFSQLRAPLARLGYPLARRLQRRFARDSLRAMMRLLGPA
jgi:uncharacterized protein (UPF0548 family)